MSASTRPKVRARFELGPWVPGIVLPIAVGLVGILASLLVLQAALLAVGVVLSIVAAARVRTFVPWLLVALLVLGQLLRSPDRLDASLSGLVLALHLLVVLVLLARTVPVRSRLQLAALGLAALTTGLIQVVAQVLVALLLGAQGLLEAVPTASTIGGALLVLIAGLLVVTRRVACRHPCLTAEPSVLGVHGRRHQGVRGWRAAERVQAHGGSGAGYGRISRLTFHACRHKGVIWINFYVRGCGTLGYVNKRALRWRIVPQDDL